MVNKICDLALVYASAADRRVVQPELIEELIADGLVLKAADIPATPPASGRIERDHP